MDHTLLLGLGGTGSRAVARVVQELERNHIAINDGIVCCAVLDTDTGDTDDLIQKNLSVPVIKMASSLSLGAMMDNCGDAEEWCFPKMGNFRSQMVTKGASAFRIKSRLAFHDTYNSMKIKTIDDLISKMIAEDDGQNMNIQVRFVSSISGGTGAGMFIEAALWIRNLFKEKGYEITLGATLLLPDVFVKTTKSIADSAQETTRHYANAYAALREINEIEKIKMFDEYKPKVRMKIGDLFDSEKLNDPQRSNRGVFDFIFFVDYQNANGGNLKTLEEYEDYAAQLTFIQLFSPTISSTMHSQADNTYLNHLRTKGLWFGSCGSAKAVYPTDDVLEYCILNTISDMVRQGWNRLDAEIEALQRIQKAKEEAGAMIPNKIDPVEKYMELFEDKINKTGVSVGSDKFFTSMKRELPENVALKFKTVFEDGLKTTITNKIKDINKNGQGLSKLKALGMKLDDDSSSAIEDLKKKDLDKLDIAGLQRTIKENKTTFQNAMDSFAKKTKYAFAESITDAIFPRIMSDLNMNNENSVYGILTYVDEETQKRNFAHPVAMRYLLYKLQKMLGNEKKKYKNLLNNSVQKLEALPNYSFDYEGTKGTIETLEKYFDTYPRFWEGSKDDYKQHFVKRYKAYIKQHYEIGKEYEINSVRFEVLQELYNRVTELIKNMETFFKGLSRIIEDCKKEIYENVKKSEIKPNSVIYVCASEKAKHLVYQTMKLDFENGNKSTNRTVIDAAYGMLCAEWIPGIESNDKYANCDIVEIFKKEMSDFYTKQIVEKQKDKFDLNIYQAKVKEIDSEENAQKSAVSPQKYVDEMRELIAKIHHNAAPALLYVENKQKQQIPEVWGYHSSLTNPKNFPSELLNLLGSSKKADAAYPKNELCCCRAVYGVDVDHFSKFKEDDNGVYYTNYCKILDYMDESEEITLMQTPHLDKTWHRTLRYLSEDKQKAEDKRFLRALLYGFAYNHLRIENGIYQILRDKKGWMNLCEGDDLVRKAEVSDLLRLLMTDGSFIKNDIKALEEAYKKDTTDINNYVETKIYHYLTTKEENNPLKLIIGYNNCRACNQDFKAALIEAIEDILLELINAYDETHFDLNRTESTKEKAQTSRLLEVYNACDHKDKENVFATWVNKFNA